MKDTTGGRRRMPLPSLRQSSCHIRSPLDLSGLHEHLYGRSAESAQLAHAYRRICDSKNLRIEGVEQINAAVVVVSGPSGTGKNYFVERLRHLVETGGQKDEQGSKAISKRQQHHQLLASRPLPKGVLCGRQV